MLAVAHSILLEDELAKLAPWYYAYAAHEHLKPWPQVGVSGDRIRWCQVLYTHEKI
jgi:hypothetical protein